MAIVRIHMDDIEAMYLTVCFMVKSGFGALLPYDP